GTLLRSGRGAGAQLAAPPLVRRGRGWPARRSLRPVAAARAISPGRGRAGRARARRRAARPRSPAAARGRDQASDRDRRPVDPRPRRAATAPRGATRPVARRPEPRRRGVLRGPARPHLPSTAARERAYAAGVRGAAAAPDRAGGRPALGA